MFETTNQHDASMGIKTKWLDQNHQNLSDILNYRLEWV
jgi:hypothetical protein